MQAGNNHVVRSRREGDVWLTDAKVLFKQGRKAYQV